MKQKDDLFHLIKSMSRSEKRYFSVEAQKAGSGTTKYLDLFKKINDMDEYDEGNLKKKFPKNLPANKNFLYETLLKSIRDYRRVHTYSVKLQEFIQDFKILYQRGLNDQAEERLKEAKELAIELGDQMAVLEINQHERLLSWYKKDDFFQQTNDISLETKEAIQNVVDEFTFLDLNYKIIAEYKKGRKIYDEDFKEQLSIAYGEKLLNKKEPEGWRAKYRYFSSLAIYNKLIGSEEEMVDNYKKVINCWQVLDKLKEEEFFKYLVDVSNLMSAYYVLQQFDKLWELIEEIQKEKPNTQEEKGILFSVTSIYKVLFFINTGKKVDLEELSTNLLSGLEQYKINEGSRMVLISNFSIYCFLCEDFERCIEWCNQLIAPRKYQSTREDIQIGSLLLKLMAAYELDADQNFENILRSTQRSLKGFNIFEEGRFEHKLFQIIKAFYNAPVNELKVLLKESTAYLKACIDDETIKVPFDLDELSLWWVKSKIERMPMMEIAKRPLADL